MKRPEPELCRSIHAKWMSGMADAWPSGAMFVTHDGTSGLWSGSCQGSFVESSLLGFKEAPYLAFSIIWYMFSDFFSPLPSCWCQPWCELWGTGSLHRWFQWSPVQGCVCWSGKYSSTAASADQRELWKLAWRNYFELMWCSHALSKYCLVGQGMIALRRGATELTHEDYMEGILEVQAKKKANLQYYAWYLPSQGCGLGRGQD